MLYTPRCSPLCCTTNCQLMITLYISIGIHFSPLKRQEISTVSVYYLDIDNE